MIKATCKYISIAEVPDLESVEPYKKIVNPLDYDFCFLRGASYNVFGILRFSEVLKLYIIADNEIDIAPAVLFECDWSKLPSHWRLRSGKPYAENFEILPEKLSLVDHWFERYIDEDPEVLKLVNTEIDFIRENT